MIKPFERPKKTFLGMLMENINLCNEISSPCEQEIITSSLKRTLKIYLFQKNLRMQELLSNRIERRKMLNQLTDRAKDSITYMKTVNARVDYFYESYCSS